MAALIAELSIVAPNALGCAVDARAPRTLFDVANASAAFAFVWLARQFCDCCQNGTDVTDMDMADKSYRVSPIRPLGKCVKFYANGYERRWITLTNSSGRELQARLRRPRVVDRERHGEEDGVVGWVRRTQIGPTRPAHL